MAKILLSLILAVLACSSSGHSWLSYPEADYLDPAQPECRIGKPDDPGFESLPSMNCPGPCGGLGSLADRNGREVFSLSKGMTTLARGQKILMKWTRNNHFGGFVRVTLVPKSQRMQKHIHEMFAFHFNCWEAGEIWCSSGDDCGTDEMGLRYQTEVVIPRVFPNGEYIFGWTWYGGTRFRDGSEKSEYGDYYSCANVVIDGSYDENGEKTSDDAVVAEHTPQYIPGMNDGSIKKCLSSVTRMDDCVVEPCKRDGSRFPASETVPHCFNEDSLAWNSEYRIRSADIAAAAEGKLEYVDPCEGKQAPLVAEEDDPEPEDQVEIEDRPMKKDDDPETEDGEDNTSEGEEERTGEEGEGDAEPRLIAIKLIDSVSGDVKDYAFNGAIDVSNYKEHMNVRVDISRQDLVKTVKFFIDDTFVHTEYFPPYYVGGNDQGFVLPWTDGRKDNEASNPPIGRKFRFRIEVEGENGKPFDNWTVYPQFDNN